MKKFITLIIALVFTAANSEAIGLDRRHGVLAQYSEPLKEITRGADAPVSTGAYILDVGASVIGRHLHAFLDAEL